MSITNEKKKKAKYNSHIIIQNKWRGRARGRRQLQQYGHLSRVSRRTVTNVHRPTAAAAAAVATAAGRCPTAACERAAETAVLVRGVDLDGHRKLAVQTRHAVRDLQVHHGQVPVLREEQKGLAELDTAQPVAERVFQQDTPGRLQRSERQLLDVGYVDIAHLLIDTYQINQIIIHRALVRPIPFTVCDSEQLERASNADF